MAATKIAALLLLATALAGCATTSGDGTRAVAGKARARRSRRMRRKGSCAPQEAPAGRAAERARPGPRRQVPGGSAAFRVAA